MTSVTPPGKPLHSLNFDLKDVLASYVPPAITGLTATTQYLYNNDRQVTQVVRPGPQTIDYNYGMGTGLLESIVAPNGTYSYTFSGNLLLYGTSADQIYNQFAYHGAKIESDAISNSATNASYGKVQNTRNEFFNISEQNVVSASGSNSKILYTYDNDQLLTNAGNETLSRHPSHGLVSGTTLGSVSDSFTYNAFGELTGYVASYSATPKLSMTITRDALGRVDTKSETVNGIASNFVYTYDAAGRLTATTKNGAAYNSYTYDSNSNRTGGSQNGVAISATYDNQDRMTSYNGFTFTYNAAGDLFKKTVTATSAVTTYTYDVFGNIKSVAMPGKTITYQTDSVHRRVVRKSGSTVTARYLYDDRRLIAEMNASGNLTKRYVYGSKTNVPDYVIVSGVRYRMLSDHVGSVRLVINSTNGAVAQQIDYDEFGRVLSDTSPGFQAFGFAGGIYDPDTKLVRFGARDYDAETGRWTTKDPIRFEGGDTNLYGYVANDPVDGIDPTGLYEICTTPLSVFENEHGILRHQYLCANGVCGGQTRSGGPMSSPGMNSNDPAPGSTGSTCEEGSKDNQKCMDACIAEAIGGPRPNYSLINVGGSNCQKWANDTLNKCAARCGGK